MSINLKAERLNKGLSAADVAKKLDIPLATYERAEAGVTTMPRAATAYKIAEFYGKKVTDIWPVEDSVPA